MNIFFELGCRATDGKYTTFNQINKRLKEAAYKIGVNPDDITVRIDPGEGRTPRFSLEWTENFDD